MAEVTSSQPAASAYAGVAVRSEIVASHDAAIRHWAAAGTWWTAAERLAIVEESRTAWDSPELPPWVAPTTVEDLIFDDHVLPKVAIDVVWRVTNHVATLSPDWFASYVPDQLSAGRYVELVGLVAQATLVDRFADGLGLDRVVLPLPAPGEPSRERPPDAEISTHWVPTAPFHDRLWGAGDGTDSTNVRRALSLVAAEREMQFELIDAHYVPGGALANDLTKGQWSLDRAQIELLGARTSAVNECFY